MGVITDTVRAAHVGAQFVHLSERPFGRHLLTPSKIMKSVIIEKINNFRRTLYEERVLWYHSNIKTPA